MGNLYERIADLCRDKGINITTMCKEAGISRAPLSDLKMNRTKKLSTETISKIAAYFGVTVDYLLGSEPQSAAQPDPLDEADVGFYARYKQLSEDEKEDMRDYLALMESRRERRRKG